MVINVDLGGKKQFEITSIWAYCAVDEGGEGLVGYFHPKQGWLPLVGADKERVAQYDQLAKQIAKETGKKIVCKKFSKYEIVKVFDGK